MLGEGRRKLAARACKRSVDLVLASIGLLATAPLLGAAALAVQSSIGSPVFFRQTRIGRGGRAFRVYKLRTMTDARDAAGHLLPDEERITRLGHWIRASSIDELPQLWNVIRGDMSLVGPRPLLPQYLPRYSRSQARRHEVRPGITGWAQIHGRNELSWEERFERDVWYVDHWSLALDAEILVKTVGKVLRRDGIAQSGRATMSEFLGSPSESTPG